MAPEPATIYIIDDDEAVRNGLALLLEASGYVTRQYRDARSFLDVARDHCKGVGCILLDQHMPGMTGLELQMWLGQNKFNLPIIFLSGHATVPTAVQAIRDGAVDFMEKPIDSSVLLEKIQEAITGYRETRKQQEKIQKYMSSLTRRECEVLDHLMMGQTSKIIAQQLCISERTVELHRAHVLHKFEVHNVAQLLQLLRPRQT